VYRPYCTGTPESDAYARLWGTSNAHTDSPARASAASQQRRYAGSQVRIGRNRRKRRTLVTRARPAIVRTG